MKDVFPNFIWKQNDRAWNDITPYCPRKRSLKIPLAHKTMATVFWSAKECNLVSFLPQGEAEMLLVNFRLSTKFVMLTLMFREAKRSSCNMTRCGHMLLIGAWRGFSKMDGNF
jgi:hypothetical protein